jgi:hypothetical protein
MSRPTPPTPANLFDLPNSPALPQLPLWSLYAPGARGFQSPGNLPANFQYAKPGPYFTSLSPNDESQFQSWLQNNQHIPAIANWRDTSTSDYDMRGFWKANQGSLASTSINPNDQEVHFPDTWKTPYHQSFSNESQYATPDAPRWINDSQLINNQGQVIFDERAR